jgi:hypothetical protein
MIRSIQTVQTEFGFRMVMACDLMGCGHSLWFMDYGFDGRTMSEWQRIDMPAFKAPSVDLKGLESRHVLSPAESVNINVDLVDKELNRIQKACKELREATRESVDRLIISEEISEMAVVDYEPLPLGKCVIESFENGTKYQSLIEVHNWINKIYKITMTNSNNQIVDEMFCSAPYFYRNYKIVTE